MYYLNWINLHAKKHIRDFIEDSYDENDSFMERDPVKNKTSLPFWVSLIDNLLSRTIKKGFFFSLWNERYNLFDIHFKVYNPRGKYVLAII